MKVLITGSSGMVGKNLVEYASLNQLPHCLITPTSQQLNLLDSVSVENYLSVHQPDFIVHAAGIVGGIQANIDNPIKFLVENPKIRKEMGTRGRKLVLEEFSDKIIIEKYLNLYKQVYR